MLLPVIQGKPLTQVCLPLANVEGAAQTYTFSGLTGALGQYVNGNGTNYTVGINGGAATQKWLIRVTVIANLTIAFDASNVTGYSSSSYWR